MATLPATLPPEILVNPAPLPEKLVAISVSVAVLNVKFALPSKYPALLNCTCVLMPPGTTAPPIAVHDRFPLPSVVSE